MNTQLSIIQCSLPDELATKHVQFRGSHLARSEASGLEPANLGICCLFVFLSEQDPDLAGVGNHILQPRCPVRVLQGTYLYADMAIALLP